MKEEAEGRQCRESEKAGQEPSAEAGAQHTVCVLEGILQARSSKREKATKRVPFSKVSHSRVRLK